MENEFVILDTNEVEIYGTENTKSDLIISSIIAGIRAGDIFESVEVQRFAQSPNSYLLLEAHHRAIAHYIEGAHLRCKLVLPDLDDHPEAKQIYREHPKGLRKYINIKDILIISDQQAGYGGVGLLENKRKDEREYRRPRVKVPHVQVHEAKKTLQKRKKPR